MLVSVYEISGVEEQLRESCMNNVQLELQL